jgi:hypothetical protein
MTSWETMQTIKDIDKLMESGVKYEYEPDVRNCRSICEIFILDVQEFIQGSIRKLLKRVNLIKHVKDMFKEFARCTVEKIITKKVGDFEDDENVVTIM